MTSDPLIQEAYVAEPVQGNVDPRRPAAVGVADEERLDVVPVRVILEDVHSDEDEELVQCDHGWSLLCFDDYKLSSREMSTEKFLWTQMV